MGPMLDPNELLIRHFWIAFVAVTCVNGAYYWWVARGQIRQHPERADGYRRLILGYLVAMNLPWLVMGFGILVGGVPTTFHFFSPRNGPFVLLWFATITAEWIAAVYWTFFRRGGEMLVSHPGLFAKEGSAAEPGQFRAYAVMGLAGSIAAFLVMSAVDMPIEAVTTR